MKKALVWGGAGGGDMHTFDKLILSVMSIQDNTHIIIDINNIIHNAVQMF